MLRSTKTSKQLGLQLFKPKREWRCVTTSQQASGSKGQAAQHEDVGLNENQLSDELSQVSIPFAHAKLGHFYQARPVLQNQYTQDKLLTSFLKRHVSKEIVGTCIVHMVKKYQVNTIKWYRDQRSHFPAINADLERFGDRVAGEIYDLSLRMEAEQPKLEQIDAWGKRVDKLIVSTAWQKMKAISAEEGLIASAYERKFGEWSRLYQIAKFYLFEPSGGLYGCPLAMTNGAAKTLELDRWSMRNLLSGSSSQGSLRYYSKVMQKQFPALYNKAFYRMVSRDPNTFWTSGQWMTEKQGGSDVARGTETVAVEQTDGSYRLYGYKWFSSATDADISLTLARIVDKNGSVVQGTRGLSMFYLEVKDEDDVMNNIQMLKLKNKLGTKQLPTAELLIDGAWAYRVSEEGRGVATMANMLTLTRIHTAMGAASAMRRIVNLARDYATRRTAFGKILHQHSLHVHTLASMEVEARAAAIFVLEIARLLGRQEVLPLDQSLEAEREVLRLIVPLAKLYISKKSVHVASEGLECFGGQGYIEDTDLPRILRDTQVNAIWEGTTNILSLDILRAINKSKGQVLGYYQKDVLTRLCQAKDVADLEASAVRVEEAMKDVMAFAAKLSPNCIEMAAREFAFSLARVYMGALLLDHAAHANATPADVYTAQRWCEKDLALLCTQGQNQSYTEDSQRRNLELVFDGYPEKSRL